MMRSAHNPFYHFMNRLSYSMKFMVMLLLILIPLVFLSFQQVSNLRSNLEEAKKHRAGVEVLKKAQVLISHLELWRDISTLNFLAVTEQTEKMHAEFMSELRRLINHYETDDHFIHSVKSISFLQRIKVSIENPVISTGAEGTNIQLIFDNTQAYIDEAYEWQRHLAIEYSLLNIKEDAIYQGIHFVLNDANELSSIIGKARTYGSYYLLKQFIDSNGISYLDRVYASLQHQKEKLDASMPGLIALINTSEQNVTLDNPLNIVINSVDEHLIQAIDLTYPWQTYFSGIEVQRFLLVSFNETLLDVIINDLSIFEDEQRFIFNIFIVTSVVVIALITLLYIGFFYSVKNTIGHLINTSDAVAKGDLDVKISTNTRDELSVLATAMDHMRVELRSRQQKLHQLSITDSLTQLNNRKFFDELIHSEVNKASRGCYAVSLLIIDIDHFKKINDTYGHPAGDECLRKVSALLQSTFKRSSDVIARYGGEEFAIILPDTDLEGASEKAENVRKVVAETPIKYNKQTINVTLSCGVSMVSPKTKIGVAELVAAADEALYEAKATGRNRVKIRTLAED